MTAASATAATGPGHTSEIVREHLERLVKSGAFPAALASTRDAAGRTRNYTTGVADLRRR
ncbi:hypothetical protein [Sphaerisporangium corydalis]|uniref:Uncharacterized protein n=1 Tax=Sphaerisporangium corydalis TaxID=1441875 RepID=A0ABV9ERH3_9ACTN|nr:hypothetical protein [Sphaerisporangium corydalis]